MKKEIVELMQRENVLQEEWDNLLVQKEAALKREERERRQKEEVLRVSVSTLLQLGMSKNEIADKFHLSNEQLERIISSSNL